MSDVRNLLPAVPSDVTEQWEIARKNMAEISPLHNIWDRSNSNWSLEHLTLTMGGQTVMRRLRQVSAEIEHRALAMSEAKFNLLRKQAELAEWKRILTEKTLTPFKRAMLEINIAQHEEQMDVILRKFNGAMKDVAALKRCYDELTTQRGGVPSAEDVEAEAHFDALVRALLQSLRDIRQSGVILSKNQEYLEQCGVNPSRVFAELEQFIALERRENYSSTKELLEFVYTLSGKLIEESTACRVV